MVSHAVASDKWLDASIARSASITGPTRWSLSLTAATSPRAISSAVGLCLTMLPALKEVSSLRLRLGLHLPGSHKGKWWRADLNRRPVGYESTALDQLSYATVLSGARRTPSGRAVERPLSIASIYTQVDGGGREPLTPANACSRGNAGVDSAPVVSSYSPRKGHLSLAQHAVLGWDRLRSRRVPHGTIESSVVPAGLGFHVPTIAPALRAGLCSLRPYGTA